MSDPINELLPLGITSATIITTMIKNPELLKIVYRDLAQPSVKKVGDALSSVIALSTTLLLPIKLLNEKTSLLFTKHMENYRKKLESIPEENIAVVPPEIGIPILDKLTYTEDNDISEMFINLLASASNVNSSINVHPYFISSINNLCPDEAVFLNNLNCVYYSKEMRNIPYLSIYEMLNKQNVPRSYAIQVEYIMDKRLTAGLVNKSKFKLYIENMIGLGFLEKHTNSKLTDTEVYYRPLYDQYKEEISKYIDSTKNEKNSKFEVKEHYCNITETGSHFINAIMTKI